MSGFHESPRFPTGISWGSIGGPEFKTSIHPLPSGHEERVGLWEGGRLRYNARYGIKRPVDLAEVQAFFRARRGALYGFRFKDFLDFHSDPDNPTYVQDGVEDHGPGSQDQEIGVGDGTETEFQLQKTYVSGLTTHIRNISKPVDDTVRIWQNAVEKTEGSDFTVDYTTGLVTFNAAPTAGHVIEASFEFDVPVRFGTEGGELLQASLDAFDIGDVPDILLIEDLNASAGYENEYFYGGSVNRSISASLALSTGTAFAYRLTATTTGLSANLPDPDDVPDGRPVFMVVNVGANSIAVKDELAATLVTLATNQAAQLCVQRTGASTRSWFAV